MMGEMADVLLYSQKVVPARLLDEGFTFAFPELQGALADLLGNRSGSDTQ
jgi:NAD dependent epimerase/dehydratase family enzyme